MSSSTSSTEGGAVPSDGETAARRPPAPLHAGRVGRAHGLDGSFYVTDPQPSLLAQGGQVTVAGAVRTIVRRAGTPQRPIVRLDGVGDRAAAEALRGQPLTVARGEAPALGEQEWWAHQLEGCAVRDGARAVGTVTALLALPSCEALQVRRQEGGELLVPLVRDAIRQVDVAAGVIEIDLEFLGDG